MRHELVEREDVGEGSLDDDVATSVTLHFTKQDPVAMWLRSTASSLLADDACIFVPKAVASFLMLKMAS